MSQLLINLSSHASPEMRHPSYFFFALENIEGSAQWFTYIRGGLDVFYNASILYPDCSIKSTTDTTCKIKIPKPSKEMCFLAHLQGTVQLVILNQMN